MARRELSREEIFALVWEKPTLEVAKELGISDVAVGKLCARLQVPKPARGYWARVQSGQTPRRPPLEAFREEIERRRKEVVRSRAAESLSKLQQKLYRTAVSELREKGIDVSTAALRGERLPELDPDLAAQILLLIQSRGQYWVKEGKVDAHGGHSFQTTAAKLVGKLLLVARPQMLVFESEGKRHVYTATGPAVFVRLTAYLQERIAALVRIVRDQKLQHVVMPLVATDFAWSARHVYTPESHIILDSTLCVSAVEIWVEWTQKTWRDENPPDRTATARLRLRDIMPIDYMPVREVALPRLSSWTTILPYQKRLQALLESEQVYEMISNAAYTIEREAPDETLAVADKIWFGGERPFQSARNAWERVSEELERWKTELETERSTLAHSILGIEVGDIITTEVNGHLMRLSVTGTTLYASDGSVTFIVNGTRFRKDGSLGKVQDAITLHFEDSMNSRLR